MNLQQTDKCSVKTDRGKNGWRASPSTVRGTTASICGPVHPPVRPPPAPRLSHSNRTFMASDSAAS